MVCLGFEPWAAGWQAQRKPRSYGGHPKKYLFDANQRTLTVGEVSPYNFSLTKMKLTKKLNMLFVCSEAVEFILVKLEPAVQ